MPIIREAVCVLQSPVGIYPVCLRMLTFSCFPGSRFAPNYRAIFLTSAISRLFARLLTHLNAHADIPTTHKLVFAQTLTYMTSFSESSVPTRTTRHNVTPHFSPCCTYGMLLTPSVIKMDFGSSFSDFSSPPLTSDGYLTSCIVYCSC